MKVQQFSLKTCSDSGCNSLAAMQNAFRLINKYADASVFTPTTFVIDVIDHVDKIVAALFYTFKLLGTTPLTSPLDVWAHHLLSGMAASSSTAWQRGLCVRTSSSGGASQQASEQFECVTEQLQSHCATHLLFILCTSEALPSSHNFLVYLLPCSQQGTAAVTIIFFFFLVLGAWGGSTAKQTNQIHKLRRESWPRGLDSLTDMAPSKAGRLGLSFSLLTKQL